MVKYKMPETTLPKKCPKCGSRDIEYKEESNEADKGRIKYEEWHCNNEKCEFVWVEEWKFQKWLP